MKRLLPALLGLTALACLAVPAIAQAQSLLPRDRRSITKRLHLLDRQGEWWSAVFMIACGIVLALPGDSFAYRPWMSFKAHGMTEVFWNCMFSGIGFARIVALVVNGYLQLVTPAIRLAASWLGLMTWMACLYFLWQGAPAQDGNIPLIFGVVVVLAIKEIVNCFLAAADVRIQP